QACIPVKKRRSALSTNSRNPGEIQYANRDTTTGSVNAMSSGRGGVPRGATNTSRSPRRITSANQDANTKPATSLGPERNGDNSRSGHYRTACDIASPFDL